jgi:hypothetical protein
MKEPETESDVTQRDSTDGEAGDVETAGETTAVAAITGPDNPKPVGADTMVEVDDAPREAKEQ